MSANVNAAGALAAMAASRSAGATRNAIDEHASFDAELSQARHQAAPVREPVEPAADRQEQQDRQQHQPGETAQDRSLRARPAPKVASRPTAGPVKPVGQSPGTPAPVAQQPDPATMPAQPPAVAHPMTDAATAAQGAATALQGAAGGNAPGATAGGSASATAATTAGPAGSTADGRPATAGQAGQESSAPTITVTTQPAQPGQAQPAQAQTAQPQTAQAQAAQPRQPQAASAPAAAPTTSVAAQAAVTVVGHQHLVAGQPTTQQQPTAAATTAAAQADSSGTDAGTENNTDGGDGQPAGQPAAHSRVTADGTATVGPATPYSSVSDRTDAASATTAAAGPDARTEAELPATQALPAGTMDQVNAQEHSVRVQLETAALGRVTADLHTTPGAIGVHLSVPDDTGRALMAQRLDALRDSLGQSGSAVHLSLAAQDQQSPGQQGYTPREDRAPAQSAPQPHDAAHPRATDGSPAPTTPTAPADGSRLVDVRA